MLERENIDNFIADDLALRNRNWGQIEDGLDARYTKVETDGLLDEKSTVTDLAKLAGAVQGGGRNLFLNSDFRIPNQLNRWFNTYGTIQWQDGKIVYVQTSDPSGATRIERRFDLDIQGDVTVSIHAKMPETDSDTVAWQTPVGLDFKYPESEYPRTQPRVEGWHTYSMVFTTIEDFVGSRIIRLYHTYSAKGSVAEIAWEKLEKGTIPTAYSRAPEDIKAEDIEAEIEAMRDRSVVLEEQIKGLLAGKANKQQEAWITPTLLNGWEHRLANNPLRYRVNQFGLLEFRGAIKNGTNRSALFVIPVGMRPAGAMQLHAINYSQDAVEISVNSNGEVEVRTSSTVWVSLEHTAGYIGG